MTQSIPLATALKTLLFDKANQFGRELGVIRRQRIFTGASLVQTLVFAWLNQPRATRDQLAQMAARCQAPVREQSLDGRFTPALAELLRRLIEYGAGLMLTARPRVLSLLRRFPVVDLQDSTVVSLPDELKSQWPGCGGGQGQTGAALKVQVRFDLLGGAFRGLQLEPGKQPDQATTLTPEGLPAGALHVSDLGYFDIGRLAALVRRLVYFLSRIQVTTAIFDERGQRLDLAKWLGRQKGATVDCRIKLGAVERLECRLVAVRCPPEVVRRRRQRLRRQAQRKSRSISTVQWALCSWTVLVTNVPAEMLSVQEALTVYGARWQVEIFHPDYPSSDTLYLASGAA
jgi:Transposase DDE domain